MAGTVNRKAMESLVFSGAFDSFGYQRAQYLQPVQGGDIFLDALVRYADLYRNDKVESGMSLFGDAEEMKPTRPEMPEYRETISEIELLHKEKDLVGMYLSSHPLDRYSFEMENFTTLKLSEIPDAIVAAENSKKPSKAIVGGFVLSNDTKITKTGKNFSSTQIEDFSGTYEIALFGKEYEMYSPLLTVGHSVLIEGQIGEKYFAKADDKGNKSAVPYTFKVKGVTLIGNANEHFLKEFRLSVNIEQLTPAFRSELLSLFKHHKGEIPVSLFVIDPVTRYAVELAVRKYRVSITPEFLSEISRLGIVGKPVRK